MTDETIFAEAVAIANPADRAAFLDRACDGNSALRREVEELLAAHTAAGDFLAAGPGPTAPYVEPDRVGGRVGPYKLLQKIGEGGMGAVYMADQEEPVRRRVALKVIKPGMDSRAVLARFEAERQALALMDHPNIAKVLDAGATPDGRPFFVMELVKGVPITKFCDDNRLTPRQRLELFVPVCQAIQHAHQKGVIHRDVKPSNVLVTLYDGKSVPKVIDFGIAKATAQKLTERTLFTEFGALIGTPEYMAPEQAELNALDIDTRADVYALGVMLYELLTGTTPLDQKRLRESGYAEMLRMIRELEAPRPSARLTARREALASVSAQRHTDPDKLPGLVRGELDWIVMKALDKDRARRYDTAAGLAKDVERHLRGDAVEACPPTLGYRLRKALRRNRAAVIVGVALAATLLAGIVGTTLGLLEAQSQRDEALRARYEELRLQELERFYRNTAERRLEMAEKAEERARKEWAEAYEARRQTGEALRKSEGLRLATTALLKKPQNHDLAAALAHEAVTVSRDSATLGAAVAAVQGLPNPRPFARAAITHPKMAPDDRVVFLSSDWVRYHPDGRHVLALNNEETVVVTFDAETLKPVRTLPVQVADRPRLEHLVFDPRGRWLVGIDTKAGLTAWDVATGAVGGRTNLAGGGVWEAEFSPAGDRLAVIGRTGDKESGGGKIAPHRLVVFALPGFERLFEFEAAELFRAVTFSRDGGKVAVSSAGQRVIRAWDIASKALLLEVQEPDKLPWPALVFSPDGTKLLDVTREGVVVRDIATKERKLVKPDNGAMTTNGATISTGADGAMLLVQPSHVRVTLNSRHYTGDPAPVRVFDLKQLRWGPALEHEPNDDIIRSQLSADGQRVVGLLGNRALGVWDATTGRRLLRIAIPGETTEGLTVSPDGRWAVTHRSRDNLRRWDFADRGILPSVEFHWAKDHALLTSDGRRVVVFRGDGRLETFNAATLRTLTLGPPKKFPWTQDGHTLVRVLADGRRVLMVNDRKREAVLYTADGEEVARFSSLASMDVLNQIRQRVLTAQQGGTRFLLPVEKGKGIAFRAYDAETGKLACAIDLGDDVVGAWRYALSADGRRLAVVADRVSNSFPRDTGPEVWNLDTGVREGKFPPGERHADGAQAFDASGNRMVTWRTGRVAVWDVATREKRREFRLKNEQIDHAALSANGKWVATYTKGELAVWDADTGANVYRLMQADGWANGIAFAANDTMLLVDSVRGGWSALDVFPTDPAAHFQAVGLRRLTATEGADYGLQTVVERR